MTEPEAATPAPVVRLHTIRTLVVSRDLAFRQRAVSVLGDLGDLVFAVPCPEFADDVVALALRERPNVVVLDTTGCATECARVVTELGEVVPRAGVVLVGGRDDHARRAHILHKWGWAEELSRAVRQAYQHGNPLSEEQIDARSC